MKYLLTVLCGILLLASCDKDNNVPSGELLDKTVILYITGDNDLSSNAVDNITALTEGSAGLGEKNKIVVFADTCNKKPMKLVISNGMVETQEEYESEFYMTSPTMMKTLLTSAMNDYKAKSYGLILWGHSTGWLVEKDAIKTRGYGYDNNGGGTAMTRIWINYPSIASTLESLPSKFDFIIGDCCLLQCAEVAYELRKCTDYIIGSPSETPAFGIPYKEIVPYLFGSSTDSYLKIADAITDHTKYVEGTKYNTPSSVIKTSGMDTLATATKKVIEQGLLPSPLYTTKAIYYFKYGGMNIMYDMNNIFATNVDATAYNEWKKAFDAAVVYKKPSKRWMTSYNWDGDFTVTDDNYGGMSMYFPMGHYDKMTGYRPNEDIKTTQWYKAAGIDQYSY